MTNYAKCIVASEKVCYVSLGREFLMVKYLSEKIADFFIGDMEEYKHERDVYVYGCEVLCSIG